MTNSANNNAAQMIRQQIANLQEVLAILEAKPAEKPAIQPPVVQTPTKTVETKSNTADYKLRIDVLKKENDYILNAARFGKPRLVKHVLNIIELYYVARTDMAMYSRSDEEHSALVGNSRMLINMLKSQEKRIKSALKYIRGNDIPNRYVAMYVTERRRAKRLINKNSEVYVKADIDPIDILTDIGTTLNRV
jgi:hypothetical protein